MRLILASLMFLALLITSPLQAQPVKYGVIFEQLHDTLSNLWSTDPNQKERAYCIIDYNIAVYDDASMTRPHILDEHSNQIDTIFRVFVVKPAKIVGDAPTDDGIDFECAPTEPELHIHTPTSCYMNGCIYGGARAFSCQPSREDYEKLIDTKKLFGVIQCDKNAFRFYYPSEFRIK